MVSNTTRKIFSLAISLLVVVISLTGVALGAGAPTGLSKLDRYTPGFSGAPGKMARDAAGNFYVTDFWGKGIMKLDRNGAKSGFIATNGRPSAVAVLPDGRLVVAMVAPQPYIAFYSQQTGTEIAPFNEVPGSFPALYRPSGITVDTTGTYIYVIDAGNSANDPADTKYGRVRVYNAAGTCVYVFGTRMLADAVASSVDATDRFKQPAGIAYEKQNNHIVVVDTLNDRLMFYTAYNGVNMTYARRAGSPLAKNTAPAMNQSAKFADPVDVAFEYNGASLYRMYVVERARSEVSVVDGVTSFGYDRLRINGSTVTGADMKLPSAVLFEKTATGGVLYVDNQPTATPADVLAIAIDSGTVPDPQITLTMSEVATPASAGSLSLSGTVSLASNPVNCSVNGSLSETLMTPSGNNWNGSVTIVAGANYILCKSLSGAITTFAEARTYGGTPTSAPTVSISQPGAGVVTKNATITVSGTSDTAGAAVKIANALAGFAFTTTTDAARNWSAVVNLAEGANVINVTAWTDGSAIGNASPLTVTVDNTAPSATISFLANGSTTVNAVQNIDGIVTEANLSSIEVNGVAVPATAKVSLPAANTYYFSVPVTLARGLNTITVKATDLVGYTSTLSRSVTLNPDIPGLTVDLPADNSYMTTGGSNITASGTSATSFTSVTASNGCVAELTPSGGNWSTSSMTVSSSFNSCQFTASGGGNPDVSEKRTINAAGTYAQLAITSPASDIATKSASVSVAGSVAAFSPAPTITIDDVLGSLTYDAGTGAFSGTAILPTEQTNHILKVVAADGTTAIRNIIYDTTLPAISIQANASATPSTVVGSIEPSAKITAINAVLSGTSFPIPLSVLGSTYTYDSLSGTFVWSADLSAYPYDEGTLSFTAVDPAANSTQINYAKGVPTGDVNLDDKVNIDDTLLCLRHIVETTILTGNSRFHGDVGSLVGGHAAQDGIIDIIDCGLILGKSSGVLTF